MDTQPLVAVPELETARLRLRGWRDEDIGPMAAINEDLRIGRWDKLGLAYGGQTTWRGFDQVWYVIQMAGEPQRRCKSG